MQGNAGESKGNIWECVQSARGMQVNTGGMYWSGCKVPEGCRGMPGECKVTSGTSGKCKGVGTKCQGNAGECGGMQDNTRGTYGSGCNVSGECRGIPGEGAEVGAKCQGNARGTYGSAK